MIRRALTRWRSARLFGEADWRRAAESGGIDLTHMPGQTGPEETGAEKKIGLTYQGGSHRLKLMVYDEIVLAISFLIVVVANVSTTAPISLAGSLMQFVIASACMLICRNAGRVYSQVWRYSRTDAYLRLMVMDVASVTIYALINAVLTVNRLSFLRAGAVMMLNLLGALTIRYLYCWLFEVNTSSKRLREFFERNTALARAINAVSVWVTGISLTEEAAERRIPDANKIRIAIIGAGRVGSMLAEELLSNKDAAYRPVCFVDVDREKIGRRIFDIPVLSDDDGLKAKLVDLHVQELVFAVNKAPDERATLYGRYQSMGFKVKVYTTPVGSLQVDGKRQIREFEVEELLFRQQVDFLDESTRRFYRDKTVLISGGGGSIGSELARQIAKMHPRQLILLDIYENNVYDVQQELQVMYGNGLNLAVEIASVRDAAQLDKVFAAYRPEVVLHAAAHKHVPLMEHNCSEAVKNNVFGTWNMVNVAEKYGVDKFIMISTDKAVNPTNVMGASKRLCEMIVLSRAAKSKTSFSCTRFGNVLGSNGSVIPLFKRQIANGGPVTLTDRRIIRYFMTIPEASQLVLTSGAMAHNGELFVLDMGRPVKILDLAENMIRLSGMEPYKDIDIVEIGLRPGEKLFEELLIKTETLTRTDNSMIFIERDKPLTREEIEEKLDVLREALATGDDALIREAMKRVVPTYHSPNVVNRQAIESGVYDREANGGASRAAG